YDFLPGQHLTVRTFLNEEEVRRSYSICESPNMGDLRIAVKQVDGGLFSTFANERIQSGAELDVMTPLGNFCLHAKPDGSHHYVAFAAGSGITPIISMIKTVLRNEPESHFTLFYGNRNSESVIFREEIEGLKNEYMTKLSVHYVLSQEDPGIELFHGRINAEKSRLYCTKLIDTAEVDAFYLCGPAQMIEAVQGTLSELGVAEDKVHFELFTTAGASASTSQKAWTSPSAITSSNITITLDGKTYQYKHSKPADTILDAGSVSIPELPYACKGGVCCTCKAKVLEGEVDMEVCYGLEKDEIQAGYVLTCQAHPKTEKVVLSFDE
ncbi:MAG: 2Fe-2S iron-sulfur cluster binding domain-containing protein, partial [Saprospiraceae bacterium]|nr:2Fe-2S iron-sulfur cluster binding domain-containing protein [Saprospiraceae bacterium]